MSKATKRKHVVNEILNSTFKPPEPDQSIVRISESRGNNLHRVFTNTGDDFLVSMPQKFRKNVWIKRGDYVLVEPIEEGDKVKAEIVRILDRDYIKFLKAHGNWPQGFDQENTNEDPLAFFNNRGPGEISESDSTDEE